MAKILRTFERLLSVSAYGPYFLLKRIWIQLIVIALMFFFGAAVFKYYEGLDWLTALLGSVSTITTIGLYAPNIVTMPGAEKILLIIVIIVSVGSAASLVQTLVSTITRKEFLMNEIDAIKVSTMNSHIIVMGYSFLGKYVAEKLKDMGVEFVVVAKDEEQVQIARSKGIIAISTPVNMAYESLKKAGVERAAALVATYDDDGDNMLIVMVAKQFNPNIRIVTIVNERELSEGAKIAKADVVIAPSDIIGHMLAAATASNEIVGAFLPGRFGGKSIAEFVIEKNGLKSEILEQVAPVLMINRGGEIFSSRGKDYVLEKGDKVYVLADHKSIARLRVLVR
jgi:voltage-gated potassium channel